VAGLIAKATGVKPSFAGRPNPPMMRQTLRSIDAHSEATVMIGDRMDTDIVAGIEAGLQTVLVLSGITTGEEAERFPFLPSRILDSVTDLVDDVGGAPRPAASPPAPRPAGRRRSHRRAGTKRAATGPNRERLLNDPHTTCSIATNPADPAKLARADTADTVHRSGLGPMTTAQAARCQAWHGETLPRQLETVGPCKVAAQDGPRPTGPSPPPRLGRTASVLTGDPPARLRRGASGWS
jgi:hypothetical protein